jgi:hypothetical protein
VRSIVDRRRAEVGDRRRPPDVVALRIVDPVFAQQRQRRLVLDALGDRLELEALGEPDDGADEVLVGRVVGQVADEVDVDLQRADA